MESNKNIKIYGTLVNHTLDSSISDNNHNDAIAYAYQIYDDKFGATPNSANFQDEINKKLLQKIEALQAIVTGLQATVNNLSAIISGSQQQGGGSLAQYWTMSQDGTHLVSTVPAYAPGFYDTTI